VVVVGAVGFVADHAAEADRRSGVRSRGRRSGLPRRCRGARTRPRRCAGGAGRWRRGPRCGSSGRCGELGLHRWDRDDGARGSFRGGSYCVTQAHRSQDSAVSGPSASTGVSMAFRHPRQRVRWPCLRRRCCRAIRVGRRGRRAGRRTVAWRRSSGRSDLLCGVRCAVSSPVGTSRARFAREGCCLHGRRRWPPHRMGRALIRRSRPRYPAMTKNLAFEVAPGCVNLMAAGSSTCRRRPGRRRTGRPSHDEHSGHRRDLRHRQRPASRRRMRRECRARCDRAVRPRFSCGRRCVGRCGLPVCVGASQGRRSTRAWRRCW